MEGQCKYENSASFKYIIPEVSFVLREGEAIAFLIVAFGAGLIATTRRGGAGEATAGLDARVLTGDEATLDFVLAATVVPAPPFLVAGIASADAFLLSFVVVVKGVLLKGSGDGLLILR